MVAKAVRTDAASYNCIVKACAKHGDVDGATACIDSMQQRQIAPTLLSYSSALRACGRASGDRVAHARKLLHGMLAGGLAPDAILLRVLDASLGAAQAAALREELGLRSISPSAAS